MNWVDTEAISVGRRRLDGADRLLHLLTPDHGRLTAVARGVCLAKNRFGSALEPFGVARVILSPGRGEGLFRVESADRLAYFSRLSDDFSRLQAAALVSAWARSLSRETANPALYDTLKNTLSALDDAAPVASGVAACLWRFAADAGVQPVLGHCVGCGTENGVRGLRFDPGGVVCGNCRTSGDVPLAAPLIAGLRAAGMPIAAESGAARAGFVADETVYRRLVGLAQSYLRSHFGALPS
ncbi:MAG: DNA repair protein RecO [Leptospirillia bacterium]